MVTVDDCVSWCTAILYIVPGKAAGTWKLPQGELTLTQKYQMLSGTLTSGNQKTEVTGRLKGDQITFLAGGQEFTGQLRGATMEGTVSTKAGAKSNWSATRTN
jgi:hypothetical protein